MARKRVGKAAVITHAYAFMSVLVDLENKQVLSRDDRSWLKSAHVEYHRAKTQLDAIGVRLGFLDSYPCAPQREHKAEKPVMQQLTDPYALPDKDMAVSGEHSAKSDLFVSEFAEKH